MDDKRTAPDLHPLADIEPIIHAQARLVILTYLCVVESADYVFFMRHTGLTWGNLATHLNKLEEAGYIEVEKTYKGRKALTLLRLTERGRVALRAYKNNLKQVLDDLPE